MSERSGRRTNERDRMGRVRARKVFRKRNGDIVREGREGKNQHTLTGGGGARRERREGGARRTRGSVALRSHAFRSVMAASDSDTLRLSSLCIHSGGNVQFVFVTPG